MSKVSLSDLGSRIEQLKAIPSMPAILLPLLRQLEAPVEDVNLQRVVDLLSHDKSLTAQMLHMANSPLFGARKHIDSVRSAVITLGLQRLRDITLSCCMLNMRPEGSSSVDPAVFWEHSLACALLARRLAKKIGYADPEKAYLAGLLHDLGLITNLMVIPAEFAEALQCAEQQRRPLVDVEAENIGITHCISGALLAEIWGLTAEFKEVIRRHHEPESSQAYRDLVAIAALSDKLCRMWQLDYGYREDIQLDFCAESSCSILADSFPSFRNLDLARFTLEVESYISEVRTLVSVIFRLS